MPDKRRGAAIAKVLNVERQHREVSVNRLARLSNLSPGRVHAILTGKTPNPGILTVLAMTKSLGKSLGWLEREMEKEAT